MDHVQKDHQFLLIKVVDKEGKEDTKFIGLGEVNDPGAAGHLKAIEESANDTIGMKTLLTKMTHLSTDGENKNVGQHAGLWKLLENARQELKLQHMPLLKSVCAVHSSALASEDLCKSVGEIPTLLSTYPHF